MPATKERAIRLPGPEVRAVLDGSKTQFREVVKPQPDQKKHEYISHSEFDPKITEYVIAGSCGFYYERPIKSPYHVGQKLWVQETWRVLVPVTHNDESKTVAANWLPTEHVPFPHGGINDILLYRAEGEVYTRDGKAIPWRSSTQMPRWASRITLEVTDVRVEQDDTGEWAWVGTFKVLKETT